MNDDASTSSPATVLAFGFKRFTKTSYLSNLDFKGGGLTVDFRFDDDLGRLHTGDPQVVLLPMEAPATLRGFTAFWQADPDAFAAVVKSVVSAISSGAAVCFYLTSGTPHPFNTEGYLESGQDLLLQAHLAGYYFLRGIGHCLSPLGRAAPLLRARRGEFEPFLSRYGSAWHSVIRLNGDNTLAQSIDVIAQLNGDSIAALACPLRRGHLFWLPMRSPSRDEECTDLARTLARCILTYVSRVVGDEPTWAQQFVFEGEAAVRKQEAEALATLEAVKPHQERFAHLRRIIWARDHALHRAVVDFLQYLGVDTEVDEQYLEDFWVKEGGSRSVICEIKAINTNVRPTSVADIVSHRAQRGYDVDFPALLVARPFASRQEVVDQQIEPNVRRRARQDNVVIVRTLDLANLYNLAARGRITVDDFLAQLHSGGGWLRAGPRGMTKVSR
jgi:hypothetical protein